MFTIVCTGVFLVTPAHFIPSKILLEIFFLSPTWSRNFQLYCRSYFSFISPHEHKFSHRHQFYTFTIAYYYNSTCDPPYYFFTFFYSPCIFSSDTASSFASLFNVNYYFPVAFSISFATTSSIDTTIAHFCSCSFHYLPLFGEESGVCQKVESGRSRLHLSLASGVA